MEMSSKRVHNLTLLSRNSLTVTGVTDVESFDDSNILLIIDGAYLSIEGDSLHISKLNTDNGDVVIDGTVYAIVYSDGAVKKQGSFLSKLFGRSV